MSAISDSPFSSSFSSTPIAPLSFWNAETAKAAIDCEIAYTAGAKQSIEAAKQRGRMVVSVKNDWSQVF
jgi:hypothetical protein